MRHYISELLRRWLLARTERLSRPTLSIVAIVICASFVVGCTQGSSSGQGVQPTGTRLPAPLGTPTGISNQATSEATVGKPRCDKLDSALDRVVHAPDPAAAAARIGLPLQAGRVEVDILVRADQRDADRQLAQQYDLDVLGAVDGPNGRSVEARARLTVLCDLARDPRVRNVSRVQRTRPA
jgi:hypothetical protein